MTVKRLALPDEVWNFRRGDGIEKAFLLADIIIQKEILGRQIRIEINECIRLSLNHAGKDYSFQYHIKTFRKSISIKGTEYHD